jgi:hypothetical protein
MGQAGCFGAFYGFGRYRRRDARVVIPHLSALLDHSGLHLSRFLSVSCLSPILVFYTGESGVVFSFCAVLALPTSTPGWTCVFVSHSMAFYYHL